MSQARLHAFRSAAAIVGLALSSAYARVGANHTANIVRVEPLE